MSDHTLRKATIRLAYERPELREHLLPLLAKEAAATPEWAKGKKFKHPTTGNEVVFGSLPAEERKRLSAKHAPKKEPFNDPTLKVKVKKDDMGMPNAKRPLWKNLSSWTHADPSLQKIFEAGQGKSVEITNKTLWAGVRAIQKLNDNGESTPLLTEAKAQMAWMAQGSEEKWADDLEKRREKRKEKKESAK